MSLSDKCLESLRTGVSIQYEVRTIVKSQPSSDAAAMIAREMGIYRGYADEIIAEAPEEEKKAVMKRVNNVINDVSRICREEIGFSIKLQSRKEGYKYKFEEWIKPTPAENEADSSAPSAEELRIKELEERIAKTDMLMRNPRTALDVLVNQYGHTVESLGEALIEFAKTEADAEWEEE